MKTNNVVWLVGILFGLVKGSDDVTMETPTSENTNAPMKLNIFKILALVHKLNHEVVKKQVALASCQREFVDLEEVTEGDNPVPPDSSNAMGIELSQSVPDQIPATPLEVGAPIQMPSEELLSNGGELEPPVSIPVHIPEQYPDVNNSPVDDQPIQLPSVPVEIVTAEGTIQNEVRKRHERIPRFFEFIMNSLVRRFILYDEAVIQCLSTVSQLRNQDIATVLPEISTTATTETTSPAPSTLTTAP